MSLTAKLRKLQKMSAKEIRFRVGEKLRTFRERSHYSYRKSNSPNHTGIVENLEDVLSRFLPGTTTEQIEYLRSSFPDIYRQISSNAITRAEFVLSGSYSLLNQQVDLRGEINWRRCPITGHLWPKVFYADVPLEQDSDNVIDVKFVWELGRQQYVVELAKGWLFSREKKYACRALELITDWLESNPIYEGVHWASSLEPAMRTISWIWCLAFLNEYDGMTERQSGMIVSSLHDHGIFLENHLSYYSSPYNHLIGEATALYLLGTLFSQSNEGIRWRNLGRLILEEHGPRQFYDDGFCVEQATGYHYYTLGFLAQAICIARQQGKPFGQLEEITKKAFRVGKLFQRTDGLWPAIGDVDYARSIPVLHEEFFDFDSLNSLGVALFSDPILKTNSVFCGEELYWLLGTEGVENWNRLDSEKRPSATILPESGYFIASNEKDWLCFDAGPLAAGLHADSTPSTAHGHMDTLQILYSFAGKPVLDDLGMPFYFGLKDVVSHARGPTAHNAITIEGIPLAKEAGRLAWSHVVPRPRLHSETADDFWNASAFLDLSDDVSIERHLLAIPGEGLWIADRIRTDPPRQVTWTWQIPIVEKMKISEREGQIDLDSDLGLQIDSSQPEYRVAIKNSEIDTASNGYGNPFRGCTIKVVADCEESLLLLTSIGRTNRRAVNVRHLIDGIAVGEQNSSESCQTYRCQMLEWKFSMKHSSSVIEAVS